jgi:hypothetical protein
MPCITVSVSFPRTKGWSALGAGYSNFVENAFVCGDQMKAAGGAGPDEDGMSVSWATFDQVMEGDGRAVLISPAMTAR